jgi:hypothetical protein
MVIESDRLAEEISPFVYQNKAPNSSLKTEDCIGIAVTDHVNNASFGTKNYPCFPQTDMTDLGMSVCVLVYNSWHVVFSKKSEVI